MSESKTRALSIDCSKIKLIPASLKDYPIIQNMGRFYVYDMSEYLGNEDGWQIPEDGLYECIDFKKYWQTDDAFPFLIQYENELAGFVIIDKKGSEAGIDFNVAQFFILRKFKNKGIGRYVAQQCFDKFQGAWEVMVIPGNTGAYDFWKSIIKNYTIDNFEEYTRKVVHLSNSKKNIFKFDSRDKLDCTGKIKWSDGRELLGYVIYKADSIELVPYDVQWPKMAELEIKKIREILPENNIIDIQHVGSTAIPGMLAKPIIDIQIAVKSLEIIKPIAIDALKKLGYEFWYENPDPERMFFVKGMPPYGEKRTHHVHIVEPTSRHWQGKILFRDYLIAHPEIANEYVNLKKELAQKHTYDREQYTDAKSKFISEILNKANDGIESSHEKIITTLIDFHYKCRPQFIRRIAIGICNEVYEVGLVNKAVIVRLSPEKRFLMGSHDHIPKFKDLNIRVPEILAEDYRKKLVPFAYQIQNKIEGKDLGYVIGSLTDEQLKILAKEIASIFKKVKTIPASNQFGVVWGGGDNELSETWTERMKIWIEESTERGMKTGVMDNEMLMLAKNLYDKYRSYFDSIKPITYYGDICSKNVMVKDGVFSGLVDLDGLTQGDPLEAIGRIKLSWYGTRHGEIYTNAVMDELGLNKKERKLVLVYSLLNKISWTCENGIQFNHNTRAIVDKEKMKNDKKIIFALAGELNLTLGSER